MGRTVKNYTIKLQYTKPVMGYNPRMSLQVQQVITKEVEQFKKANMVKDSCSPYSSATVVVPKRDGSLRMTINF